MDYQPRQWLSFSSICSFARCPRHYYYNSGLRLEGTGPRLALDYGTALHASFGWLLEHPGDMDGAMLRFHDNWTPECEALNDKKRNSSRAFELLLDWSTKHKPGNCIYNPIQPPKFTGQLQPAEKNSQFEAAFAFDVGLRVPVMGKIDGIGRHRNTNELMILEFKTCSDPFDRISPQFIKSFDFSPQLMLYSMALRALGLEEPMGAFADIVLVSSRRVDNIIQPIRFKPHLMHAALQWTKYWGGLLLDFEDLVKNGHKWEDVFWQDLKGCYPYTLFGGHGFVCDYAGLCDIEHPENLLGMYTQRKEQAFVLPTIDGKEV